MRVVREHIYFIGACVFIAVGASASPASADELTEAFQLAGAEGTPEELRIWELVEYERFVKAREDAEKYLAEHPDSFVAELSLGVAQHFGEANFPMALFHLQHALELFEARFGPEPPPDQPWRWHARILRELVRTHADLEHYDQQLVFIERYNTRYTPLLIAERAWPLMKKREFDLARMAAEEGLATDDPYQVERALNAICTIEFEMGHDAESYEACRDAVDFGRDRFGSASVVDLSNYAEAARSIFRFDEVEQILIEATRARQSWYGSPWIDLADLYMRAGRFAEALSALREVPRHRAARPPHVRNADRNEARRSLASFLLLMGKPGDALRVTGKALVLPDRRSHNSRDPEQDRAIVALVDTLARSMQAEIIIEQSVAHPFYVRWWARAKAHWERFQAWMSAQQVGRFLNDEQRLVGTFAIGTASSAVTPPWLIGELVRILGPGVTQAAIDSAARLDSREGASAYYDAFGAEAALAQRRYDEATVLARRALRTLQPGEALLRERVRAILGRSLSDPREATAIYEEVLATDPGLFRRLRWALPVRVEHSDTELDELVADALGRSPRFDDSDDGLRIEVRSGRACLFGRTGAAWGCSDAEPQAGESETEYTQRIVDSFHSVVFSPRVDLSRIDINSLDGSNRTLRDPDQLLLEPSVP
ncbi:MAG: hypothetical protein ACERNK_13400 [Deltaproteobacteria bacterium]